MGLENVFSAFSTAAKDRTRRHAPQQLFSFTSLPRDVQAHLFNVYTTLAVLTGICAFGVWLSSLPLMFWTGALGSIGLLGSMGWLSMTPPKPGNKMLRQRLCAAAALSQGLVIGPLVNSVIVLSPGVVLTALLATTVVFVSFSGAALLSPRRSYPYLGGYCAAALGGLAVLQLGTWAFGGQLHLLQAHLYVGLLVFAAYLLYDTQVIVERASAGHKDELRDALDLFLDGVAIFIRLLVILAKKAQKEQERERVRTRSTTRGR